MYLNFPDIEMARLNIQEKHTVFWIRRRTFMYTFIVFFVLDGDYRYNFCGFCDFVIVV